MYLIKCKHVLYNIIIAGHERENNIAIVDLKQ